jgi:heme/copper-type cytochrome/quinol oxidase subunit 2
MTPVEIALIILITIWSIIFIVIGIAVLIVFLSVRRAMKKVDTILDRTEELANKADLPSKLITASIVGFMAKNGYGTIKKIIATLTALKNSK